MSDLTPASIPRKVLTGCALLLVLVLVASLYPNRSRIPFATRPRVLGVDIGTPRAIKTIHRVLHLVSFGALAVLLVVIARTPTQLIYSILGTILLGLGIEYGQHWVFRNPVEWRDVRDDSFATISVFLASQVVRRRWAGRSD